MTQRDANDNLPNVNTKWGVQQQRIDLTKWVGEGWHDLVTNHFSVIEKAWKASGISGLLTRIDGQDDEYDQEGIDYAAIESE